MAVNYQQAVDAAIVLDYKGANQAVVKGLNRLKPMGMSRQIVTVEEFRQEFARQFAGGGNYSPITFGGSFVTGDTDGQDALKAALYNKTRFNGAEMLIFLNNDDFITTDDANDEDSGMQVSQFEVGEADKNGVYPVTGQIIPNGRLATYTAHLAEGAVPTLAFVKGTPDTITDSASGFVTAGFQAGMSLLIIGSTSNDAIHAVIDQVAAGTLTLSTDDELTSEPGIKDMELHGGKI